MKNTLWTLASTSMAAGILAGCAAINPGTGASSAPAGQPPVGGKCNATPAQSFVGKDSTASVMEAARVQSGAYMARVLRPGQMVTKEYLEQRLNLVVDDKGRITAVHCG